MFLLDNIVSAWVWLALTPQTQKLVNYVHAVILIKYWFSQDSGHLSQI